MTYSAKSIASSLIRLSTEHGLWISNLKLQRILYFSWLEYFRRTGNRLFYDEFQAWGDGPVVPSVYYEYWANAANTLFVPHRSPEKVDAETEMFLLEMLAKYKDHTSGDLVRLSIKTDPWMENYYPRKKNTIPVEFMEYEALHPPFRIRVASYIDRIKSRGSTSCDPFDV